MQSLVINPGHFRVSETTSDIRMCPDFVLSTSNLLASQGQLALSLKPSGCLGGVGARDALCRDGLVGIYCTSCNVSTGGQYFYSAQSKECLPCGDPVGTFVALGVTLGVCFVLLGVGLPCLRWSRSRGVFNGSSMQWTLARAGGCTARVQKRLQASAVLGSIMVTLKTLLGFYQIVSEVEEVFTMKLPLKVAGVIRMFWWLDLEQLLGMLPLGCIGLGGYTTRLEILAAFPVVLVVLATVAALAREALSMHHFGWQLLRATGMTALKWTLLLTFLTFPDVSSFAFQVFRCECFGEESWLRADVRAAPRP